MTFSTRLVLVVVALLTSPIASRGQECNEPTLEDVESAGGDYLTSEIAEGGPSLTMTVHNMHFTCSATVALNKYSYASVVVNATSSAAPSVTEVLQFQLECSSSNEWGTVGTSIFDSGVDDLSDPFNIETDFRCSQCQEVPILPPTADIVILTVEMNSALVLDQTTVAKASTMIPVLVWKTVQPLIPTLNPMMTLFVPLLPQSYLLLSLPHLLLSLMQLLLLLLLLPQQMVAAQQTALQKVPHPLPW